MKPIINLLTFFTTLCSIALLIIIGIKLNLEKDEQMIYFCFVGAYSILKVIQDIGKAVWHE